YGEPRDFVRLCEPRILFSRSGVGTRATRGKTRPNNVRVLRISACRRELSSPPPERCPVMPRHSSLSLLALALLPTFALAQLPPQKALESLIVADGLQVELFAHEPDLINPTSIDVDHLGRVWVCEAVNYRRVGFGRPILRPEGDRIVILEDTKGV